MEMTVLDKMKLVIFSAFFHPHKGGVEKYVEETAVRLIEKGHEVDVVTAHLKDTKVFETYKGITIIRVPSWLALNGVLPVPKFSARRKVDALRSKGYDAVITQTRFFPHSLMGALFARKAKLPLLHIEHGTKHTGKKPFIFAVAWLYDHTLGWFVLKTAKQVAGISKASEVFAHHLCKKKTVLLPNAIDGDFFKKTGSKKPFAEKVIVFVGRLIEAKGVQDIIEATRRLSQVKLIIIGAGNFEKQLKKLAHENVVFTGEKDAKEIRDILSYADVFVNPSYAEGLPTSVLEAGAIGIPVIATDVGGTGEVIVDGKTGLLVALKDVEQLREKIEFVLKNKAKANSMAQALQNKVRSEFEWSVTVERLEKSLKKLIHRT